MAAYKFTISRRSITNEIYEVEADTEQEAMEIADSGDLGDALLEWVDWYDGSFDVDSREAIDPLLTMIKNYESKTVDQGTDLETA